MDITDLDLVATDVGQVLTFKTYSLQFRAYGAGPIIILNRFKHTLPLGEEPLRRVWSLHETSPQQLGRIASRVLPGDVCERSEPRCSGAAGARKLGDQCQRLLISL